MNQPCRIAIVTTAATISAVLMLAPTPGRGQSTEAGNRRPISATRARNIAESIEMNASTLTVFNRQGNVVTTVGPRALYGVALLSPDGKRVAAVKLDLENESRDVWVFDVATGASTRITTSQRGERGFQPVWSPDGSQVAYIALRGGSFGFYRKASNGQGPEDLIYKFPGSPSLAGWSMDGRFLSYFITDLTGGTLYVLPLDGAERKPVEVFHSPKQLFGSWLSPDSRFLAYTSNESGRTQIYVRPRDPAGAGVGSATGFWQISNEGGFGGHWRQDGKEFYYLAPDQGVMAVDVNTSTTFSAGKPKLLFRPAQGRFQGFSISHDGQRILMEETKPQLRELTIFDRQGKVVKKVGEPGFYRDPGISPDGSRLVVERRDPKTGNQDVWTFDVATGKGYAVTDDVWFENGGIWTPDGDHVAYVSTREQYSGIYRKAWQGTGEEELLFRYTPGAFMELNDWSADGKLLSFATGAVSLVALRANEKALDRKAIEWMREEYDVFQGKFSPDMRYVAYLSNQNDVDSFEVYVRPFDGSKPDAPAAGSPVRVSRSGARGMINWRKDGKELYFLDRDRDVVAVEVTTTPTFQAGAPKVLFKVPGLLTGDPDEWENVSANGERFVLAMPVQAGVSAPSR